MRLTRELSASQSDIGTAPKRQKTDTGQDDGTVDMQTRADLKTKNAHLKGRRRFLADVQDMQQACMLGMAVRGLRVCNLKAGEEEENVEFTITSSTNEHVASVNLLVSDPTEYPKEHTFYAYCGDANIPASTSEVINNISSSGSRTLYDTVYRCLYSLAWALNPVAPFEELPSSQSQETEATDEEDFEESYYDEDDHFGGPSTAKKNLLDGRRLQEDFIETVASSSSYRPGLVRFGHDSFAISVSTPVVALAETIPVRVLVAWDRRLLARSQHLTLLVSGFNGCYPALAPAGTYTADAVAGGAVLKFKVGLTGAYKPGRQHALDAIRTFALVEKEEEPKEPEQMDVDEDAEFDPDLDIDEEMKTPVEEPEDLDPGRFERFALSTPLETLMDRMFLPVLQLRTKFKLGWAGAETLFQEIEQSQRPAEELYAEMKQDLKFADKEERQSRKVYELPLDPLEHLEQRDTLNLPLVAFSYLLRRLMLCPRYCTVCHKRVESEYEALKPYVCGSKLCEYQYYHLNLGPSVEYEICVSTETVDLLVSTTYVAAADNVLDPLPIGLGLRVPPPKHALAPPSHRMHAHTAQTQAAAVIPPLRPAADGKCDFDQMHPYQQRAAVVDLLDALPSIPDMKKYLEKAMKSSNRKPRLREIDPSIEPAAWALLRWCIGSCTAHLEQLSDEDEVVRGIDPSWKQFRFSVGAPDAEAKFNVAIQAAQQSDRNAKSYPSLYAFHGSALKNWHSIIRTGLQLKEAVNGRAYGHGVYFALDGSVSMGTYAMASSARWRKSLLSPGACVAVAEIVNLPQQFVSKNPYLVVAQTSWIICRYLLVKMPQLQQGGSGDDMPVPAVPYVRLDPAFPIVLGGKAIQFPDPAHKLGVLLGARQAEQVEEAYDEDDDGVFKHGVAPEPQSQVQVTGRGGPGRPINVDESSDEGDDGSADESWALEDDPPPPRAGPSRAAGPSTSSGPDAAAAPVEDDWEHDPEWVRACTEHLMPPPVEATPSATMALQRELKSMLAEQKKAHSLRELGWYMAPETVGDNLFQWIVELHSFDPTLPVAKDMEARGLNSLIFEIRFPPSFPHSPPFFRIIKPRFLPFIQGGGGHVTGGGSMCMDLLTADGWLPSYSISSVLLQIRLAISNLEPRPARLASNWDTAYSVPEALEGYKRAAATHGWKLPPGLERLVR